MKISLCAISLPILSILSRLNEPAEETQIFFRHCMYDLNLQKPLTYHKTESIETCIDDLKDIIEKINKRIYILEKS